MHCPLVGPRDDATTLPRPGSHGTVVPILKLVPGPFPSGGKMPRQQGIPAACEPALGSTYSRGGACSKDLQISADPEISALIEAELPFLQRAARRWARQKADADDLVQDTVLRGLDNSHQWQPDTNLRAWLYTIMRNRFLAGVQRSKRFDPSLDAMSLAEATSSADSPETGLVMRDLERALARLPTHQRAVVRLVGIEGKSYEDAARQMEMSVPAVRCHLARGREQLRAMLDGPPDSPRSRPVRAMRSAALSRALDGATLAAQIGAPTRAQSRTPAPALLRRDALIRDFGRTGPLEEEKVLEVL